MEDTRQLVVICLTIVLLLATLVGGISGCTVLNSREQTLRIQAACAGDLHIDAVRASACTLALMKTHVP